MSLRLEIVSRQRQNLGERGVKEFGHAGGTIGRSLESDWVLPDGQRFLSSRHASIDYRSGSYYIIDTSTNGVFINESEQPVGRGNPQRLFSGDRVRMADYELIVEIDEDDGAQETLMNEGHVDPVDAAQRVDAPEPTSYDLVDAYEITGAGLEMMLDEADASTLSPLGYQFESEEIVLEVESPEESDTRRAKVTSGNAHSLLDDPRPDREQPKTSSVGRTERAVNEKRKGSGGNGARPSSSGLDAFFKGAGLDPRSLSGPAADATLRRLGQVMREMIVGMTECLQLRSLQKARLRQSNTTIQARDNNTLKFSAGVEEAIDNLLFKESEQYLGGVESVREAFGDINAHQRALLNGMQHALIEFVERLEPDHLEEKFSNGRRGSLIGAAKKLKYWDLYRDLYLVMSQHAEGELPQAFLEAFGTAYEQEIEKHEARRTAVPEKKLKAG